MEIETFDDNRIRRMIDFENELSKLAETYTPIFQEAVEKQLDDHQRRIYSLGIKRYSSKTGRWYDPWGIPDSILDFNLILEREKVSLEDKLLAFAVLIYHDSGYPKLRDSSKYADKNIRDLHMREGALNFASDLINLVLQDSELDRRHLFTRNQISSGFQVILHHDDKFSGKIENASNMLQIFMDGDNIFIPSFVSSYKDYVSRYARPVSDKNGKNMDGGDFLRMRQSYFFKPGEDKTFRQRILITEDSDRLYAQKSLPIRFDFTKKVIAAHLLARTDEMEKRAFNYVYNGEWESFKPYAIEFLRVLLMLLNKIKVLMF